MVDQEMLLAISNLLDMKRKPLRGEVRLLSGRMESVEGRLSSVEKN